MTGKVILWLCVIWVPLVLYFFLANETKFKKNIVIGTTLPFEARTDPDVQARLGKFKRQLGAVCLILTALALMGLFLPLSMGESLTAMLVWTDLAIVAPLVVYVRCNRDLRAIKAGRGWGQTTAPQTVTVDLSAAVQPAKELSFRHFLPPLVVSAIPVAGVWAAWGWVAGVVFLVNPLCILLFWLLYRYAFRRKSEVVDGNTDRTQALTRLRRQYWRRSWLWLSWFMALFALALWGSYYAFLPSFVAIGVLTLGLVVVAFRLEFRLRRAQEKLTADSGTGFYVDEDDKWLWGLFYYAPNDRRLVVNARVGISTSVNLARRSGKIIMGLCAALLIFMPLLGIWVMGEESAPVELTLTDTALVASHGGDRYEIDLDDIAEAELLDAMPSGLRRVAGTAMDTVRKGQYAAAGYASLTLCLDPREGPWLLVTTTRGGSYLFGAPGVTEGIARQLGFPGTAPAGQ